MNTESVENRWIVRIIAVNQLVLSVAFLAISLYGSPLAMIFGLWGFVNACILFGTNALSRIGSLIWHTIFVVLCLGGAIKHPPSSQPDNLIVCWAVVDLVVVFYLAKITLHYVRNRIQVETGNVGNRE